MPSSRPQGTPNPTSLVFTVFAFQTDVFAVLLSAFSVVAVFAGFGGPRWLKRSLGTPGNSWELLWALCSFWELVAETIMFSLSSDVGALNDPFLGPDAPQKHSPPTKL